MQVLIRKSDEKHDLKCDMCGQGFRLYWERPSAEEQAAILPAVQNELREQHATDSTSAAHPDKPFNFPDWTGSPQFSGAALLGGLSTIRRAAPPELDRKN
jgi:hypothetical protein